MYMGKTFLTNVLFLSPLFNINLILYIVLADTQPSTCSQLVIILDTNPVWWGQNAALGDGQGVGIVSLGSNIC